MFGNDCILELPLKERTKNNEAKAKTWILPHSLEDQVDTAD